jgi:two-component system KDP operon response regulator KdpE
MFKAGIWDLVIVDLTMSGLSGIDLCPWIRAQSDVPIIIVSGHEEEELKVQALDAGADDYVIKPFSYEELLARVRAVVRRSECAGKAHSEPEQIEVGDLLIDLSARRVSISGEELHFTQTEYKLLAELARNVDKIMSHAELLARVWGPEYRDESHYLHIYFGRIREKLGSRCAEFVETVPAIGYMLRSTTPSMVPQMAYG